MDCLLTNIHIDFYDVNKFSRICPRENTEHFFGMVNGFYKKGAHSRLEMVRRNSSFGVCWYDDDRRRGMENDRERMVLCDKTGIDLVKAKGNQLINYLKYER